MLPERRKCSVKYRWWCGRPFVLRPGRKGVETFSHVRHANSAYSCSLAPVVVIVVAAAAAAAAAAVVVGVVAVVFGGVQRVCGCAQHTESSTCSTLIASASGPHARFTLGREHATSCSAHFQSNAPSLACMLLLLFLLLLLLLLLLLHRDHQPVLRDRAGSQMSPLSITSNLEQPPILSL